MRGVPGTGAVLTEDAMALQVVTAVQQTSGPVTASMDNPADVYLLILRANNTGMILTNPPQVGQVVRLAVQQGAGGPFTWVPAVSMKFAGGSPGPTATVAGHRDIYTLIFDGTDWCETARALNVG